MRTLVRSACCLLLPLGVGSALTPADCGGDGFLDGPAVPGGPPRDCNGNGVPDECDIAGRFGFSEADFSLGLDDPVFLASGDLDGDGDADLVTLHRFSKEAAILLNLGGGVDFEARRMDLTHVPVGLAAADLDGDGLADLVLTAPSSLIMLRNSGDARFLTPEEIPLPSEPAGVFTPDLDSDGDLDLAVIGRVGVGADVVSLLPNAGDGRYGPPRNFGVGQGARWLAARDLDGDKDIDLAVACDGQPTGVDVDRDGALDGERDPGAISILWNRGDGSFRPAETFDPGMFPVWIDAGDLDGDGDADLVATGAAPGPWMGLVMSFRNEGGAFQAGVRMLLDGTRVLAALDDFDADGDPDLALARLSLAEIEFRANDGSGRFSSGGSAHSMELPAFLLASDLDQDGDRDFAMAGFGPVAITVLVNAGALAFGRRRDLAMGKDPRSVGAIDIDRDGDLDLAVASASSREVTFFWNDGSPAFRRATFHELAGDSPEIVFADLDADGFLDLSSASDVLRIEWGEGAGRFGATLEAEAPGGIRSLVAVDADGDGRPDLAATGTGSVLLYLNSGGRVFAPPRPVITSGEPQSIISGDLDGDGDLDLAVGLEHAGIQVLLNDGRGGFRALPSLVSESVLRPTSIGSADLDLDGDLDLVASNISPDGVAVLTNSGDAAFEVAAFAPLSDPPFFAAAADLDGDGDPEILTTGFRILDNRAAFEGVAWRRLSRRDFPANIAADDLDGNGLPDLISFTGSRSALVFLNRSSPPDEPDLDRDGIPDGCEHLPFHRGDVLADGRIDISDAVSVLGFLFLGESPPHCAEAADADNDGSIVVSDAIQLLTFLFLGGPSPAPPGPATEPCGPDPDAVGSAADLGCASYSPCL
jgi:hypothetical protein